jgi:xanthine dehydrogenase accessory factor
MQIENSPSDSITDLIRELLERGSRAVLATIVESRQVIVGAKLLVSKEGGRTGDLGHADLNHAVIEQARAFFSAREETKAMKVLDFAPQLPDFGESLILFERIEAEPRLVIAGAGHVGASLARLAALVGYRVTLIDDRTEFVVRDLFSGSTEQSIELVAAANWIDAMRDAIGNGRGVSVAIVTRGHKQDEDCLRAAATANPDYIGMIGSKRRTNIVLDKLREEGIAEEQLGRVHAPIGLDIGAVSPEEVALAILAEIVNERHGGSGGSLSAWRRN